MKTLTAVKKAVDKFMEWCCIIILGIMTVLVTYQVVTRYFFNNPSAVSETAAQYLFVWMVMFGSAYVFGLREHLSIDVFKDKYPPLLNMLVEILINVTLLVFSWTVCASGGFNGAMKQMTTADAALKIPIGYIYAAIPVCGVVMIFYAVYNIFFAVSEYKTPAVSGEADVENIGSTM